MHTSYAKHMNKPLSATFLLIKFCLFWVVIFCGVNGVVNGLLTRDQAVLASLSLWEAKKKKKDERLIEG